jgi:hypothetical protein
MLCLIALGAIALVELQQGQLLSAPLLVLAGLLGVVTRSQAAPLFLLLLFAASHYLRRAVFGSPFAAWYAPVLVLHLPDVIQCAAFLTYCAAQYRVQALLLNVFPPDPRRREVVPRRGGWLFGRGPTTRVVQERRSSGQVPAFEAPLLVLTVPLWALLAQGGWLLLSDRWNVLGLPLWIGRLLVLLWVVGMGLLVTFALLGYWKRRTMRGAEAGLFLQDTLWRETRREQRRVARWLAWARLRRPPGKETT